MKEYEMANHVCSRNKGPTFSFFIFPSIFSFIFIGSFLLFSFRFFFLKSETKKYHQLLVDGMKYCQLGFFYLPIPQV